ncbi:hypothetical protein [Nibrella viscosa]|uniref:hypothetical protein n=1 Tax=Nibrella viscosa TaxID=1084524 RepID=UPI0031EB2303
MWQVDHAAEGIEDIGRVKEGPDIGVQLQPLNKFQESRLLAQQVVNGSVRIYIHPIFLLYTMTGCVSCLYTGVQLFQESRFQTLSEMHPATLANTFEEGIHRCCRIKVY